MTSNQKYEAFFEESRTALTGALTDDDARTALATFGYEPRDIEELRSLLDDAEAAYRDQRTEYAEKVTATQRLQEKRAALRQRLSRHRRIARVVFKPGTGGYNALALNGRTERSYTPLIQQALHFYEYLQQDADVQAALERFTITADEAVRGVNGAKRVRTAHQLREKEAKEAQVATEERDDLVFELRGRMSDFLEIAAVAFETLDLDDVGEVMGLLDRE